jgi:hypothetical protein
MKISFLVFLLRRLWPKFGGTRRRGDFVGNDQSRIAGVCREISDPVF